MQVFTVVTCHAMWILRDNHSQFHDHHRRQQRQQRHAAKAIIIATRNHCPKWSSIMTRYGRNQWWRCRRLSAPTTDRDPTPWRGYRLGHERFLATQTKAGKTSNDVNLTTPHPLYTKLLPTLQLPSSIIHNLQHFSQYIHPLTLSL